MKLQISFDMENLDDALRIAKDISEYADIIEIGTSLLVKYGIQVITQFKNECPKNTILVDSKIIDRGSTITTILAEANPDWITVMAGTSTRVIHSTAVTAEKSNISVMMDLLDAQSAGQSALEAKNLSVDALLFHQSYEEKDSLAFIEQWEMVRGNTQIPIFVSVHGGRETINDIIELKPDGIVIGTSITQAPDPRKEAEFFHKICHPND